jgi:hypothetical protein
MHADPTGSTKFPKGSFGLWSCGVDQRSCLSTDYARDGRRALGCGDDENTTCIHSTALAFIPDPLHTRHALVTLIHSLRGMRPASTALSAMETVSWLWSLGC